MKPISNDSENEDNMQTELGNNNNRIKNIKT